MACLDQDDTGKPKKMRRSKKGRKDEELTSTTTTTAMNGSNETKRKKKRKTTVSESDDQICSKKLKEDNDTEKQSKADHCLPDHATENMKSSTDGAKVKRKNKKKKTVTSEPSENKEKHLKRKARDSAVEELDVTNQLVDSDHANDAPVMLKKKKKSSKKHREETKENEETPIIAEKKRLGKKKMFKSENTVTETDSADINSSLPDTVSDESCEDTNMKKKLKKRKSKIEETSDDTVLLTPPESIPKKKKKKRKVTKPDSNSTTLEEPVSRDVESVGDVAINQVKEKKKKSKKKKRDEDHLDKVPADAAGPDGDSLGQWQTAELSSKSKEKFARLLGARKSRKTASPLVNLKDGESVLSKLSGVWKPPPERTMFWSALSGGKKFSSMAMDREETAKLNQSLETQYTKTLDFNLQKRKEGNKAKGLGFQEDPAKGKKHYIDINKVNSVALE